MSPRAWLALAAIALFMGGAFGWSARSITAGHRFITNLALRHEAEASYYYKATDRLIQQNKATAKEQKHNGTKEN